MRHTALARDHDRSRGLAFVGAVALLVIAFGGCGGGSSSSANDKPASVDPANACTLLTRAQAEKSTGAKLSGDPRPDSNPPDGTHGCVFPTADGALQFAIDVQEKPGLPTFSNLEAISDVGAAARYDARFHRVYVDSGKQIFFQVRFVIGDIPNERDVGAKVAKTVVANL